MYKKGVIMKDTRISSPKLDSKKREQARYVNSSVLKKRRKRNYTFYYILLLLFITIFLITLSVTVFFNIKDIEISGLSNYNGNYIVDSSGVQSGDNLFRVNVEEIAKNIIKNLIYIDEVTVEKNFPNKLKISVVEGNIFFYIKESTDRYIYISKNGRILEKSHLKPENAIEILGISDIEFSDGEFLFAKNVDSINLFKKLYDEIKTIDFRDVREINISEFSDLKIQFGDNIEIHLGSISDIMYKLKLSLYIIENKLGNDEKGIIDVRDGNKAVFKPIN